MKAKSLDGQSERSRRSRVVRDGLKLCALRGACTVSRGGSRSNAASLPDLAFIGPKSEAEEIKRQLANFLDNELKLNLSQEKTLITNARSDAAKLLGYEI